MAPIIFVGGLLAHGVIIAVWRTGSFPLIYVAIYHAGVVAILHGTP
jgi:hypothetical protein